MHALRKAILTCSITALSTCVPSVLAVPETTVTLKPCKAFGGAAALCGTLVV